MFVKLKVVSFMDRKNTFWYVQKRKRNAYYGTDVVVYTLVNIFGI